MADRNTNSAQDSAYVSNLIQRLREMGYGQPSDATPAPQTGEQAAQEATPAEQISAEVASSAEEEAAAVTEGDAPTATPEHEEHTDLPTEDAPFMPIPDEVESTKDEPSDSTEVPGCEAEAQQSAAQAEEERAAADEAEEESAPDGTVQATMEAAEALPTEEQEELSEQREDAEDLPQEEFAFPAFDPTEAPQDNGEEFSFGHFEVDQDGEDAPFAFTPVPTAESDRAEENAPEQSGAQEVSPVEVAPAPTEDGQTSVPLVGEEESVARETDIQVPAVTPAAAPAENSRTREYARTVLPQEGGRSARERSRGLDFEFPEAAAPAVHREAPEAVPVASEELAVSTSVPPSAPAEEPALTVTRAGQFALDIEDTSVPVAEDIQETETSAPEQTDFAFPLFDSSDLGGGQEEEPPVSYEQLSIPLEEQGEPPAAPTSVWDRAPQEAAPVFVALMPEEVQEEQEQVPEEQEEMPPAREKRACRLRADCTFLHEGEDAFEEQLLAEPLESIGGANARPQIQAWKTEIGRRVFKARLTATLAIALTLLLAVFELFPRATASFMSWTLLARVPGVAQLIDLQLLLLACLLSWRPLWRGLVALFHKRVLPETLAFLGALCAVVTEVALYLAHTPYQVLTGLVAATLLLGVDLAELFRMQGLAFSFKAFATEEHRFAACLSDGREHPLCGELFRTFAKELPLLETDPVTAVDGYVDECRRRRESPLLPLVCLGISACAALTSLIILLVLRRGADIAFWSACTVLCGTLPLSAFLLHRLFFHNLSARISRERVGVSGEDAVYRIASAGAVTFEDVEAFPQGSVRLSGIKLCGDFPLDKALYLVASIFDRVGGPLNGVFRVSATEVAPRDDVELFQIAEGGIAAFIARDDVHVGTKAYLEDLGIEVFRDPGDERVKEQGGHVLYVAYQSRLAAKFYVHYQIDDQFEKTVEYCAKNGVSTVILTADPLLSETLLDQVSYVSDYDVRIVKKDIATVTAEKSIPRTASLITYGPRKTLRRMPFLFASYKKRQKIASALALVLSVCGAVLVPTLMNVWSVTTPLIAFLYQLGAAIPAVALGCSLLGARIGE